MSNTEAYFTLSFYSLRSQKPLEDSKCFAPGPPDHTCLYAKAPIPLSKKNHASLDSLQSQTTPNMYNPLSRTHTPNPTIGKQ